MWGTVQKELGNRKENEKINSMKFSRMKNNKQSNNSFLCDFNGSRNFRQIVSRVKLVQCFNFKKSPLVPGPLINTHLQENEPIYYHPPKFPTWSMQCNKHWIFTVVSNFVFVLQLIHLQASEGLLAFSICCLLCWNLNFIFLRNFRFIKTYPIKADDIGYAY